MTEEKAKKIIEGMNLSEGGKRLKACDTRQAFYPHELSDELKTELAKGYQGPSRPDLDHLME